MGALTTFALQTAIILALEYLVYKWLLSTSTHFALNRTAILGCYALALIVPLVAPIMKWTNHSQPADFVPLVFIDMPSVGVSASSSPFGWYEAIPLIYLLGAATALAITLCSAWKMRRIISNGQKSEIDGAILVVAATQVSPFSWGRYIVVSPDDATSSLIISHELTHVKNHHTIDLAAAQLMLIFNWFNPAAYLMRRELTAVHEYQVDEQVLRSGANPREYQMLLIKKTVGSGFQSLANSLNHSQLKNRVTMMLKSKSSRVRRWAVAALPAAAVLAMAVAEMPAMASVWGQLAAVSYSKISENSPSDQAPASEKGVQASTQRQDVVETPDVMPQYPGGEAEMYRTMANEIRYPEEAAKDNIQGKVVISFIVNADGHISDAEILKSCGNEQLDAEALRVVKAVADVEWTPGTVDGKPVNVTYALPITFKLNGNPAPVQAKPASQANKNVKLPDVVGDELAVVGQGSKAKSNPEIKYFVDGVETPYDTYKALNREGKLYSGERLSDNPYYVYSTTDESKAVAPKYPFIPQADITYIKDGREISIEELMAIDTSTITSMTLDKESTPNRLFITTKSPNNPE